MEIVDSQVHIWHSAVPGSTPQRPEPFELRDLLPMMDEAGVDRAILVPPTWDPDGDQVASEAARRHPGRFAVMAEIDFHEDVGRPMLAELLKKPEVLGIRLACRREPYATWVTDGTLDWVWGVAADAGFPVMVYTPGRLEIVDAVLARHPGLKLAVDHMGILPFWRGEELAQGVDRLVELARYENVMVKVSAVPVYSDKGFPFPDMHQHLETIIGAFGARRCFWGTDISRLECTYSEAIRAFTEHMPFLSPADIDLVMGRAILDWLGWA